ncbi:MAG: hypothetical protein IPK80_20955 [Nannocystis sp.]|nr:hypothetical protein [Nannocystis sp.]
MLAACRRSRDLTVVDVERLHGGRSLLLAAWRSSRDLPVVDVVRLRSRDLPVVDVVRLRSRDLPGAGLFFESRSEHRKKLPNRVFEPVQALLEVGDPCMKSRHGLGEARDRLRGRDRRAARQGWRWLALGRR